MKRNYLRLFFLSALALITLVSCGNSDNPVASSIPVSSTTGSNPTTSLLPSISTDISSLKTATINLSSLQAGGYQTNFHNGQSASGIRLGGYRVGNSYQYVNSYHYNYVGTNYEGRDGAIYNVSAINNIYSIELSYSASNYHGKTNPRNPYISFGEDRKCESYIYNLEPSALTTTKVAEVGSGNFKFFAINTGDYDLNLATLTVKYTSSIGENAISVAEAGKDKVRFNPIRYTGNLTPGESKIKVPTGYKYNEDSKTYEVTSSKELTYYTTDYIRSHPEEKENATITDPMEVCMYYATFSKWPANYSTSPAQVNYLFGSDARKVSTYSRTDGYATSIPWNGNGRYHELDIDFDGTYSTSSRGTGRVVVWERGWNSNSDYGFTAEGYDSSPVCVYTDDHYNTWLEYYNNGTWSNRYNAEGNITGIKYSAPKTVEITGFDPELVNGSGTETPDIPDPTPTPTPTPDVPDTPKFPVDDGTTNHAEYYANYAPVGITNEETAKYQKVTSIDGIKEGSKYLIVVEDSKDRGFYNFDLIYTISEDKKTLTIDNEPIVLFEFYFEKDEETGSYYFINKSMSGDFTSSSYFCDRDDLKSVIETINKSEADLWNISFANGHIILSMDNRWLQYQPDGGFETYILSSDSYLQYTLYRYCDVEV